MYRDLVYRPGEDSYNTRDFVFRPDVDTSAYQMVFREPAGRQVSFAEVAPYPVTEAPSFSPQTDESVDSKAQLLLELFMRGMGGDLVAGLPEPMSQEEFQHEVTKRMDRNKPSVQDVLRNKFGVGSIREGIGRGIFPAPPRLPGI